MTGAQWSEFDLKKMYGLFLPASKTKQRWGANPQSVITQNMIIMLDELRASFGYLGSKYVFPSTTCINCAPEQPIDRHSLSRAVNRKQRIRHT